MSASPIVLAKPAHPGGSYQLPSLYVINVGTEAAIYQVRVQRLDTGSGRTVPVGWVKVGINNFALQPQESRLVPLQLAVPADAESGAYVSDLIAWTATATSGGGASLGSSAATLRQFRVEAGAGAGSSLPGWAGSVALVIGAILLVVLLVRFSGLRLRVERRR